MGHSIWSREKLLANGGICTMMSLAFQLLFLSHFQAFFSSYCAFIVLRPIPLNQVPESLKSVHEHFINFVFVLVCCHFIAIAIIPAPNNKKPKQLVVPLSVEFIPIW